VKRNFKVPRQPYRRAAAPGSPKVIKIRLAGFVERQAVRQAVRDARNCANRAYAATYRTEGRAA
jgi:hypothetical protein